MIICEQKLELTMKQVEVWSEPFCSPKVCVPYACNHLRATKPGHWPMEFSDGGSMKTVESPKQAERAINAALEDYESISDLLQRPYDPDYSCPVFDFEDFQIQVLFDPGPNPLHMSPEDCPPWAFHLTCKHCGAVWHLAAKCVSNRVEFHFANNKWMELFLNLLNRIASISPGPSSYKPDIVYFY